MVWNKGIWIGRVSEKSRYKLFWSWIVKVLIALMKSKAVSKSAFLSNKTLGKPWFSLKNVNSEKTFEVCHAIVEKSKALKAVRFKPIAWQTSNVFAELTFFSENQGFSSVLLDKKADFDTAFDFIKAIKTFTIRLQKSLYLLFFDTRPIHIPLFQTIPNPVFLSTQSLRAPPPCFI